MKKITKSFLLITNIPTPYRIAFYDELAKALSNKGIEFKVLYCSVSEPNRHWDINQSNFNHNYKIMKGFHYFWKNITFHFNPEVIKCIKEYKPSSIMFSGSWNMPTLIYALIFSSFKGPKIFWSEGHEDAKHHDKGIIPMLRKFIFNRFRTFAVPNHKSKNWIVKHLNQSVDFINLPNTVDESFYTIKPKVFKQNELINPEATVFLQISQLEERKGVKELVSSFIMDILPHYSNTYLIILGTGSLYDELQALSSQSNGHVKLLGHVDGEEVKEWLYISDWFVLNTKLDPNPLTPIEASLTKTPLILSNKAGNFDELCMTNTGIEICNVDMPSIALKEALNITEENRVMMGEKAYDNVMAHFTRGTVASNFANSINKLIKENGR